MITLNHKEKEYILSKLDLTDAIKEALKDNLTLSDEIADVIRELCIEKLDVCGYDKKYESTKDGIMLNRLIDKLYVN